MCWNIIKNQELYFSNYYIFLRNIVRKKKKGGDLRIGVHGRDISKNVKRKARLLAIGDTDDNHVGARQNLVGIYMAGLNTCWNEEDDSDCG